MKKKVMIGISGGVDSSVAALLLLNENYDLSGVTLKNFSDSKINSECEAKICCLKDDINDAKKVCDKLKIEHYIFNSQ